MEQAIMRSWLDVRFRGSAEMCFSRTKFGLTSHTSANGKPEYLNAACENSLKRLKVETFDLYYLHRLILKRR